MILYRITFDVVEIDGPSQTLIDRKLMHTDKENYQIILDIATNLEDRE
jgi:hypothetical protein